MKCNCIKNLENELLARIKQDEFKNMDDVKITPRNLALIFGKDEGVRLEPYMEFEITAPYKTKSGKDRNKRKIVNISYSYCPFCGKPLK